MCAPKSVLHDYLEWISTSHNEENADVVVEFFCTTNTLRKYQGWLMVTGAAFDRNWKSIQMRITNVAKFFGLSRSGVEFFKEMGLLVPIRSCDRDNKKVMAKVGDKIE